MRLHRLPSLLKPSLRAFQDRAFAPALPHLLPQYSVDPALPERRLPAIEKWFQGHQNSGAPAQRLTGDELGANRFLALQYLLPYLKGDKDPFVPLEITRFRSAGAKHPFAFESSQGRLSKFLKYLDAASTVPFEQGYQEEQAEEVTRIYLAQAPLSSTLPSSLLVDLPTPSLVTEAGKGDLYDSSLWLGVPPTYTPLHEDPNDNIFVQLAGSKLIRVMRKQVGEAVIREGRRRAENEEHRGLGMRGEEMMVGREREMTDALVWDHSAEDKDSEPAHDNGLEIFEAEVQAGDACFIPRGWWHSIKSVETRQEHGNRGVVASVNWWFR